MGIRLSGIEIEACNIYYPRVQVVATAIPYPSPQYAYFLIDFIVEMKWIRRCILIRNSKLEVKEAYIFKIFMFVHDASKGTSYKLHKFLSKQTKFFQLVENKFDKLSFCDSRFSIFLTNSRSVHDILLQIDLWRWLFCSTSIPNYLYPIVNYLLITK